jgi:outer membrane protein assembly factor BamE (lipoprotein component of BamABCDE complex)
MGYVLSVSQIQMNRICLGKKRAIRFLLFSVIALFQIGVFGCFCFIPTKQKEPRFTDESVSQISPGTSTKAEVKAILGQPDSIRKNDSIYIYSDRRKIGIAAIALPLPVGGISYAYKIDHIIIQFNNSGIVQEVDHIYFPGRKKWRTTKNGIFVATDATPNEEVILYAQSCLDRKAKQFLVPAGKSAIYFYWRKRAFFLGEVTHERGHLYLDNTSLSDTTKHGYFYLIVDPGMHQLKVSGSRAEPYLQTGTLSINCKEGQIYFVEQTWKLERIFPKGIWSGQMRTLDKDEGQSAIKKRRLILDCLCLFE